jgi:hypothetical protein
VDIGVAMGAVVGVTVGVVGAVGGTGVDAGIGGAGVGVAISGTGVLHPARDDITSTRAIVFPRDLWYIIFSSLLSSRRAMCKTTRPFSHNHSNLHSFPAMEVHIEPSEQP